MSVLFKETNRQSKMKKEPQPTPARASTEALRFCIKIDLYSDILGITDFDGKTYGATLHLCSEGRKPAIFNLYPDRFWLCPERLEK